MADRNRRRNTRVTSDRAGPAPAAPLAGVAGDTNLELAVAVNNERNRRSPIREYTRTDYNDGTFNEYTQTYNPLRD